MIRALEKTDLVVVDCRAASTEVFFNYFDEIDLPLTLKNLSAALTLIMPVNQEADSIDQLQPHHRQTQKRLFLRRAAEHRSQRQFRLFMTTRSSASGC